MMRILHLCSTEADFEARRSIEQLSGGLGADFAVESRTIGHEGRYRNWGAALLGLRRSGVRDFDLIHTWDVSSLLAAAMGTGKRLIFTPPTQLGRSGIGWLRAVMGYRDVQVVCPTATLRRMCVENGVAIERCHLIRPGVDFARVKRRRDPRLRAALGFEEDDRVMLLAGETTRQANHRLGVWSTAMLNELDGHQRVLLWGRGAEARAVKRFAEQMGQKGLFALAEEKLGRAVEFEELLPAADVILVTAEGPVATLPIAIAMAAGLPIVSTVDATVSELLEDRHTALMVGERSPRALARRVMDLREDASMQWAISDMARTEAYEYFALTRFLSQYRVAYRQAAGGEKVELPAVAPGAGLRFHGRG